MNKDTLIYWLLWAWVGAMTVAYGFQFKGFVRPVLSLLGLS